MIQVMIFTQTFGKNLAKFVFQNLKNRSFNKFLDMGCGSGDVTFEILKVIKCEEVHAYDFSKSSINKTKEKLSNLDPKLTCMVQDIYNYLEHLILYYVQR